MTHIRAAAKGLVFPVIAGAVTWAVLAGTEAAAGRKVAMVVGGVLLLLVLAAFLLGRLPERK